MALGVKPLDWEGCWWSGKHPALGIVQKQNYEALENCLTLLKLQFLYNKKIIPTL